MNNYFGGNYSGSMSPTIFRSKTQVATYNDLPITNNTENDLRSVADTDHLYTWSIAASSGSLSDWIDIGSTVGNLDTIADGSTYGKVLLSELESGQVKRLDDGSNEVTAANAKSAVDLKHTQGTDLGLDTGGANPVTAETIKGVTDYSTFNTDLYNTQLGHFTGTPTGNKSTFVGDGAGQSFTTGAQNTVLGAWCGGRIKTGSNNLFAGYLSANNTTVDTVKENVGLGTSTLQNCSGNDNVAIGMQAGKKAGNGNIYIGAWTGVNNLGDANVIIGGSLAYTNRNWSNKLAIDVSDRIDPLVFGDFTARTLQVNGDLETTGDLTIKTYIQETEPVLDTDGKMAIWADSSDNYRIYLVFRRASGDQVSVELG